MDESRRFGKICWSDHVMLTEASVCGNIRIMYVDQALVNSCISIK